MISQKLSWKSSPVDPIFEDFEGLNFLTVFCLASGGVKIIVGAARWADSLTTQVVP
jgi:hypothetical protein